MVKGTSHCKKNLSRHNMILTICLSMGIWTNVLQNITSENTELHKYNGWWRNKQQEHHNSISSFLY